MMEQGRTKVLRRRDSTWSKLEMTLAEQFLQAQNQARQQASPSLLTSVTGPIAFEPNLLHERIGVTLPGTAQFFWMSPNQSHVLLGMGSAKTLVVQGNRRFEQLKDQLAEIRQSWYYSPSTVPKFLGGFSFQAGPKATAWAGWEDGLFVLPRFLLEVNATRQMSLIVSQVISVADDAYGLAKDVVADLQEWFFAEHRTSQHDAATVSGAEVVKTAFAPDVLSPKEEDISRHDWEQLVRFGAQMIRSGGLRKVVFARRQSLSLTPTMTVQRVLTRLRQQYPESYVFAIWRWFACFTGASPERLVRVEKGQVAVDALAGTIGRGKTATEDEEFGNRLLHSSKDRTEHAVVVERITSTIGDLVEEVHVPHSPVLKKFANVQHLFTPVTGSVKGNFGVIDFAERLHPTPAVAGEPRDEALKLIAEHEGMDRGWYASPVGWFAPSGDGEFAVALRSALIQGNQAHLFAGAGIMGDSNPSSEWEETELKLQAMRMALEESSEGTS